MPAWARGAHHAGFPQLKTPNSALEFNNLKASLNIYVTLCKESPRNTQKEMPCFSQDSGQEPQEEDVYSLKWHEH